ncbi:LPS export ABC transporter periplasmic protein LptC [Roseivirga sp.]|uniref:LPS export ABC transporter periplasmic protein LptC n=1 Tax=Roseivirga sp. TaxID=1964215 RepID=UPI002B2714D9|nr:LPS export ABC transporter periplasmic protein LptC [Roseivirga sp.]
MTLKKLIPLIFILAFTACFSEPKKLAEMEEYKGPILESENVEIIMTEGSIRKLGIKGNKQLTFSNGDLEFPETIRIDFFDGEGDTTSVLTALEGFYDAKTKLYRATGDVVVINLKENQTLKTEELFWNPNTERIYTDQFFIVTTETDLIQGTGMDAPQDFSEFKVTNPKDTEFLIKETNENN